MNTDLVSNDLNFYALVSGPVPSPFEKDDEYSPTDMVPLRVVDLGVLRVPSGRVEACDPFAALGDGPVFAVEPGDYSIRVTIPFVHWPETMATYLVEEKILFPCDAFGGYGMLPGVIFDDECPRIETFERDTLRYYSNIIAGFSANTKKAIDRISEFPIEVVAPSHGLVWRKRPERIVELYKKWVQYAESGREKAVTLVYSTMYGNTTAFAEMAMQAIAAEGLPVEIFDVRTTDIGEILASVWKNQGLVVCAPTYEGSLFPGMVNFLNMMKIKKVFGRTSAYFGSFGWGSTAKKQFEGYAAELKWSVVDNYQFHGKPKAADFERLPEFAGKFAAEIRAAA